MNASKLSLTREGLERAIAEMGLTQTSLADRLDVSARTMRRYVSGDVAIPAVVQIAIHYLVRLHREAAAAALVGPVPAAPAPPAAAKVPDRSSLDRSPEGIDSEANKYLSHSVPVPDPEPEEPPPSGNVSFSRSNFPK